MASAVLVLLDDDGDLWVWPGGRYVDLYTDVRHWAAGNTPHLTFEVSGDEVYEPYEPEAFEAIVGRLTPRK